MKRVPIGQILLEEGTVSGRQLRAGLDWQKRWGGRLGNALVHLGMLKELELVRALARQVGMPVIDLSAREVDPEVLRLVPRKLIESRSVLPVQLLSEHRRGPLLVATSDPLDLQALDEVAFASGKLVRPMLAPRTQIDVAIARYLGRGRLDAVELPPEPIGEMELVQPVRAQQYWN
jgi:type IV pilus assembly protein PilB